MKKDSRKENLTDAYFKLLDKHLDELASGEETEMMELSDIASELCVSHQHLIAIIKETCGHHPCHFYVARILDKANELLAESDHSVSEIARRLTYDPSNFVKFYKKYTGMTPGRFRANLACVQT